MQWFRFYNRTLNNPKAQRLSGELFKHWVNLLCVTSQCDGRIVTCDISYHLRVTDDVAVQVMDALVKSDLMVRHDDHFVPKDWDEMQYKSDTSAERTRRYRDKKKTVTRDVTDAVTVTDPDTEQKQIQKQNREEEYISEFSGFWAVYPDGNPKGNKQKAQEKFIKIRKSGVDLRDIAEGLGRYQKFCNAGNYNQHAITWLNQDGWKEEWSIGRGKATRIDQQGMDMMQATARAAAKAEQRQAMKGMFDDEFGGV